MSETEKLKIKCVTSDGEGPSYFSTRSFDLHGPEQRRLSAQIDAVNFRLRTSDETYASDWHVAGDPTLLVVSSGTVRIELRNGDTCDFSAGEMFIAQDYLADGIEIDSKVHGHRAEVVGDQGISVLHLKLGKKPQSAKHSE